MMMEHKLHHTNKVALKSKMEKSEAIDPLANILDQGVKKNTPYPQKLSQSMLNSVGH
jgi:hypothetical protein